MKIPTKEEHVARQSFGDKSCNHFVTWPHISPENGFLVEKCLDCSYYQVLIFNYTTHLPGKTLGQHMREYRLKKLEERKKDFNLE